MLTPTFVSRETYFVGFMALSGTNNIVYLGHFMLVVETNYT